MIDTGVLSYYSEPIGVVQDAKVRTLWQDLFLTLQQNASIQNRAKEYL